MRPKGNGLVGVSDVAQVVARVHVAKRAERLPGAGREIRLRLVRRVGFRTALQLVRGAVRALR